MNASTPPDQLAILAERGPRNDLDPLRPYAHLIERERTPRGDVEEVTTIFLTNKECSFKCLMCDLWKNTTVDRLPEGAAAAQVEWVLGEQPFTPHVKLYNAGSFFDQQAISAADRGRIAELMAGRRTVIVECHPRLIDDCCVEFARRLGSARLEVALGLETVDPVVLPRLNKSMTLDGFERAAVFLGREGIGVRAFILVRTPYQSEEEGVHWATRSLDCAFDVGVECCVVIPVRGGNGIMERLRREGLFEPPSLRSLETVFEYGVGLRRGRVFVDLWDVENIIDCAQCSPARVERLGRMNLTQRLEEPVACHCGVRV